MSKKFFKKVIASSLLCAISACYTIPAVYGHDNEETIYSKADTSGKNYKTVVSTIEENNGDSKTNQQDINKELPIEYTVTYKLNGQEISANEIAGKSGKVTITLKFTNKLANQVSINGKSQTMYTPFLVVSGVVIDNDSNRNIQVNHGKVINNGDKTIVAGIAVPGLSESLNIKNSKLEINDTIEFSLETDNFELRNIMTYASPKVFDSLDITMSDFNDLFNQIKTLKESSQKIENGASALNEGIITLDKGVSTLKTGATSLEEGVDSLDKGAKKLDTGASTLKSGTAEYSTNYKKFDKSVGDLSTGTSTLNTNYTTLDTGINTLNTNLSTASKGSAELSKGMKQASDGINQIVSGLKAQITAANTDSNKKELAQMQTLISTDKNLIKTLNTQKSALKAQKENADTATAAVLQQQIDSTDNMIKVLTANYTALEKSLSTINNTSSQVSTLYSSLTDLQTGMNTLSSKTGELEKGLDKLSTGSSDLVTGSSKIASGIDTLNTGASQLSTASGKLNKAAKKISSGASDLQDGTSSLTKGTKKLSKGANTLNTGVSTLSDGSKKLVKGSGELLDGIRQFNTKGISKIYNLVNVDARNLVRRIEALEDLSKNYSTFASDTKRDSIQFITVMDSISTSTDSKKDNEDRK